MESQQRPQLREEPAEQPASTPLWGRLRLSGEGAIQRWAILVITTLLILLTTGSAYGWAPMLIILQDNNVYSHLCVEGDPSHDPITGTCEAQEVRLNLIYTLGAVSMTVSALAWGTLADWKGPRCVLFLTAITFGIGCLIFAFSDPIEFDAFIPGWMCMGFGGGGHFFSLMLFCDFFDASVTVLGIYNLAFDASSFVFPAFKLLYDQTGLGLTEFFIGYSTLALVGIVFSIVWPRNHPPPSFEELADRRAEEEDEEEGEETYSEKIISRKEGGEAGSSDSSILKSTPKKVGRLAGKSFLEQMKTWEYFGATLHCMFSILCFNFYMGTVPIQLEAFTQDEATIDFYSVLFSWLVPASFIVSPFIGWTVEKASVSASYLIVQLLGLAFSVLKMIPSLQLQVVTFSIFSLYRGYFYCTALTFILRMYGFGHFGKLWGVMALCSAGGNYTQNLLLILAYRLGGFWWLDVVQLIAEVTLFLFPAFLWLRREREESTQYELL